MKSILNIQSSGSLGIVWRESSKFVAIKIATSMKSSCFYFWKHFTFQYGFTANVCLFSFFFWTEVCSHNRPMRFSAGKSRFHSLIIIYYYYSFFSPPPLLFLVANWLFDTFYSNCDKVCYTYQSSQRLRACNSSRVFGRSRSPCFCNSVAVRRSCTMMGAPSKRGARWRYMNFKG